MARGWQGIPNRAGLTDHGPRALREAAVDIVEHAIRAVDPYQAALDLLGLAGNRLRVGGLEYDLGEWEQVYVIGAGKATQSIALALEEVLGDRITDGLVILKRGETSRLRRIRAVEAAHPVPDAESQRGAREIVEIARRAGPRDLVFALITGGSSALMVWPPEGISLNDKQALNEVLLASGADIREINAVRKHVSQVKGGRLAQAIFPAELINLTASDVIGDPLDYITDPTVPDTSTYLDAWKTLDKYDLWERVPPSIRAHLRRGPLIETPKTLPATGHTFVLIPGDAACREAMQRCQALGFATHLATAEMQGESRERAQGFVALGDTLGQSHNPGDPYIVVASGEVTVAVDEGSGQGGPYQEFALSAALAIAGRANTVVAAVDIDGSDGPTAAAGGLVDGETVSRARSAGLDPAEALAAHAAHDLLAAAGDLVLTGPTGANVNDLILWLAQP